MHHHESECQLKRLGCYPQGQGHIEGSFNQYWTFFFFLATKRDSTSSGVKWIVVKRLDCCVQGQGHSDGSKGR